METNKPENSGDHIQVGNIQDGKAIAIGRGATAVYQGLSVEEVATLVVELKNQDQPIVWNGRTPYLGLTAFQESDAEFFFGRESLVDDLLERVQQANFIVIAGPSGSGKSSVARAGLLHALRSGRLTKSDSWLLASMQPKGDPIEQLALALERATKSMQVGDAIRADGASTPTLLQRQIEMHLSDDPRQRCVILVDQFEETFTQTKNDATRAAFINLLTTAQAEAGRIVVILSLRSDFISHCARYPALRRLMSQQFQLVGAMAPPDLAKAITLPALEVGAEIDPALVARIMADMKGEPGALPLMSFALRDLFEAEKSAQGQPLDLTLPEYVKRGGIESALERHANTVFDDFSDEQKALARGVFSKLIEVGQGRADTRRTAAFTELVPAGTEQEAVQAVVAALAQEGVRLITTSGDTTNPDNMDAGTVTIAHEKLIDAWPWLRQLVDENREMIALQNQIHEDAQAWAQTEDTGFLYRGGRLIQVEERLQATDPSLDSLSQEFIRASLDQRQKEIKEKETQRLRTIYILAGATFIAIMLALTAFVFFLQSNENSLTAKENLDKANFALTAEATAILEANANLERAIAREAEATRNLATSVAAQETATRSLATSVASEATAVAAQATTQAEAIARERSEAQALEQKQLAEARSLAAQAETAIQRNDSVSAYLFALQAVDTYYAEEAATVLAKALIELLNPVALERHTAPIWSVAFSPNGIRIIIASWDYTASLWDEEGTFISSLEGHKSPIISIAINEIGNRILTASLDGDIRLWDSDGIFLKKLEGHFAPVWSAVFNHDSSRILTAGEGGSVRLWDSDGNFLKSFEGHKEPIWSATFSPSGNYIVTASNDYTVKLWDEEGTFIAVLDGHTAPVVSVAVSSDENHIITASNDHTARLWEINGNFINVLEGHTAPIRSAVFNSNGTRIITASDDDTAKLWDGSGNLITTLRGHTAPIRSAVFNHDGSFIVTASNDNTAKLWDINGNLVASLDGHSAPVTFALFNNDSSQIVTVSDDQSAKLWTSSGTIVPSFENQTGLTVPDINDYDKNILATNEDSSRIVVLDEYKAPFLQNGDHTIIAELKNHTDTINMATFNHDGSRFITAGNDRTAMLWDENGKFITVLKGHTNAVNTAVFNYDDSLIVTASDDYTARLWTDNGLPIATLKGHTGAVKSASFSQDGRHVITIDEDGIVRNWEIYTTVEEMRSEALRRLLLLLSEDECLESHYFAAENCQEYKGVQAIQNGSFSASEGWNNLPPTSNFLINQQPAGWELDWVEPGEYLFEDLDSTASSIPEAVHKLDIQLPPNERLNGPDALILEGDSTYKIFHNTSSFGATLSQTVTGLEPGSIATLNVPIRVNLNENKDVISVESGAWLNGKGNWVNGHIMEDRQWYHHVVQIVVPNDGKVEIVIRVRNGYQHPIDFYIDNVTLFVSDN